MARVRARQRELDEAKAALVILSPEPVEGIARVASKEGWPRLVLGDPDRKVYPAFGLGRLPWHRVFTWKTILMYGSFMLRGRFPGKPGQDVMQQGGDFIVDGEGIVRYAYAGRSSDDRPPVDLLMHHLRGLAPGSM